MNKTILIGRLTKDLDLRKSQNGHSYAKFILAVNRRFKKENEQSADFIDQFRECICSDRVKYLKDAKGHIFKVFTYGFADTGLCDSDDTPRMISFNFKECCPVD